MIYFLKWFKVLNGKCIILRESNHFSLNLTSYICMQKKKNNDKT